MVAGEHNPGQDYLSHCLRSTPCFCNSEYIHTLTTFVPALSRPLLLLLLLLQAPLCVVSV
jgi:hypothetical protein